MNSDYQRIAQAIDFITANQRQQPSLEEIAAHLHLSPFHFQRLFRQWAGVTPKKYLQILTLAHAKKLLAESKPLLEVTASMGLSSSSRLYDHFVQLDAVTPGEFKTGGAGIQIQYSLAKSPFGDIFIGVTPRGICKLSFVIDNNTEQQIADLQRQWPNAELVKKVSEAAETVKAVFAGEQSGNGPLSLYVRGTNFQVSVWRALLQIDPCCINSYGQVAAAVGRPKASRAVGTAIGSNPVAFFIPCHRVLQQSGQIGGYLWGETRKHAIYAWESARRY
ncbi:MAG: methylated-DNA--[protein]-cysteine S-methyltransferase [Porticoccaceae bacterium]|nr:methylated-DNA--[protein]-cysteine S-methyltransferase [Porticoccaceae bacterium]MDG1310476.1 methylated-DNA--[protein]-cysteine S-methyltransferase [Porticoccaceae bacterium]